MYIKYIKINKLDEFKYCVTLACKLRYIPPRLYPYFLAGQKGGYKRGMSVLYFI